MNSSGWTKSPSPGCTAKRRKAGVRVTFPGRHKGTHVLHAVAGPSAHIFGALPGPPALRRGMEDVVSRFALAFLIVGFVAAFYGFAGVAATSLDVAKGLFAVCLVGFVIAVRHVADDSGHSPR
jgi:uncharacterized membrane protein YtjA (UPF0391 family)